MAKPKVRNPGSEEEEALDPAETESNVDDAIAHAAQGKARRIVKPKPKVPPSKVKGDPGRPGTAAVNAKREMSYEQAMKALEAANELEALRRIISISPATEAQATRMAELQEIALTRSVLTERGWVVAPNRVPPGGVRV